MRELIERLEKEGGSRELDAEVFAATSADHTTYWSLKRYQTGHEEFLRGCKRDGLVVGPTGCGTIGSVRTPNLTTSLDAAIALCERVLPDPFWGLHTNRVVANVYHADVGTRQPHRTWLGSADIPATALCIALLRALEDGK